VRDMKGGAWAFAKGYRKGAFARQTFTVKGRGQDTTLAVAPAEGTVPGQARKR
jgi:hypothetical protein